MNHYTGLEYLKIDIANHAGHDKELFPERIVWIDKYENDLEDLVDIADNPFQYLAAVMAYRDTQKGIPTGHMVEMDACASGLQLFAALTGCKTTAMNTGLTGQVRADMYQKCTDAMSQILEAKVDVSRGLVKDAQMPKFYGSINKPKEVFGDGTEEYHAFHKANEKVAPGACEALDLLLNDVADPEATRYAFTLPDGFEVDFPTMFNHDVRIEVDELEHTTMTYRYKLNVNLNNAKALGCTKKGYPVKSDPSIAANLIHGVDGFVVREMCRRCNYNSHTLLAAKYIIEDALDLPVNCFVPNHHINALAYDSGFCSLVGIEYIDANTVLHFSPEYLCQLLRLIEKTLQRPSFEVVTIHDAFKAHANYINTVRQTYIDIMSEIADSSMLQFLVSTITGESIKINKYTDDLGDLIRQSEYALS